MSSITEFALSTLATYGPLALALLLFLGAAGSPLPGTLLVIAAGAFVRQGIFDGVSGAALGLLGVVIGDSISYSMGHFADRWVQRRIGHTAAWQTACTAFHQRGWLAVYLTRCLLTPLAIPTNLIAGSSAYPFWLFLLFALLGEATWIAVYGTLGYAFGSQWELIGEFAGDFSGLIVGIVLLLGALYWLFRRYRSVKEPLWHSARRVVK